ncbi:hypothetical protein PF003_g4277 [Phytophthora fragariae]|nr:hypothetical protein PF003_g4277 [Phytophthora fragariae]
MRRRACSRASTSLVCVWMMVVAGAQPRRRLTCGVVTRTTRTSGSLWTRTTCFGARPSRICVSTMVVA